MAIGQVISISEDGQTASANGSFDLLSSMADQLNDEPRLNKRDQLKALYVAGSVVSSHTVRENDEDVFGSLDFKLRNPDNSYIDEDLILDDD